MLTWAETSETRLVFGGEIIKAAEEMLFPCCLFLCLHVILFCGVDASSGPAHLLLSTAASTSPTGMLLKALFTGASLSGGRRHSFVQTCTGRANNPLRVASVTEQALLLDGGG